VVDRNRFTLKPDGRGAGAAAQDAKVVESACLALTRIAQALAHSAPHLELLCGCGLIGSALQLVAVSDAGGMTSQLSVSTYYGLVRLLTTCTAGSPAVAESLLQAGVSGTLRTLLARRGPPTAATIPPPARRSRPRLCPNPYLP